MMNEGTGGADPRGEKAGLFVSGIYGSNERKRNY